MKVVAFNFWRLTPMAAYLFTGLGVWFELRALSHYDEVTHV
jgi:hypothetical protein